MNETEIESESDQQKLILFITQSKNTFSLELMGKSTFQSLDSHPNSNRKAITDSVTEVSRYSG